MHPYKNSILKGVFINNLVGSLKYHGGINAPRRWGKKIVSNWSKNKFPARGLTIAHLTIPVTFQQLYPQDFHSITFAYYELKFVKSKF